ncbi:glycoside hydrolase family 2 protein [Thalassobacillus pellis]|uniref:glycoside hydrolase family 2 protein n=1 Tax=Thalassobacillus pellis TaxID=748008 RepID=UPI0019603754|nr:sugar-binding domain-containing protein [Thalassobacillus pellis]MBM7551510.1 beta-galactosidase/beta-glucuronidase [Thalassobacillus pellis]
MRPRAEHSRPDFKRKNWLNLNGEWNFTFDDKDLGLKEKWFRSHSFPSKINVPYAFQTKLSGIEDTTFHDVFWYHRKFEVPEQWERNRVLLHFGAVDYRAAVWVNGEFAVSHEGGHTPFYVDITDLLIGNENDLVVRCEDFSTDLEQPRGKQFWEENSKDIFYTRTSGIWQTVWLENVGMSHLQRLKLTPDTEAGTICAEYVIDHPSPDQLIEMEITFKGQHIASTTVQVEQIPNKAVQTITLEDFQRGEGKHWSPEQPNLYDMTIRLTKAGEVLDEVSTYFGMRSITIQDGKVLLNGAPYYMKLVLDQGYYPESLLTAPDEAAIRKDIELTKAMGFNGVRKHQKVEEPLYLYWADKMGLLIWGEMANSHTYSDRSVARITSEWQEAVERDYNHPSIVVWVPLNESWGVPRLKKDLRHQQHALAMYHLTKSLDATRPVIANDGWEHVKSDILSIHDYEGEKEVLKNRYKSLESILSFMPSDRHLYIPGFSYDGEPIHVSEFGGIAFESGSQKGWGYTSASNEEDFIRRYEDVVSALLESPLVQGFCYTQLTDVEQEINGLLTYDRKPKAELDEIKRINTGNAKNVRK